jgi:hypothetical protein
MPDCPYLPWPVFRRSGVAALDRSLTGNGKDFHARFGSKVDACYSLGMERRQTGRKPAAPSPGDRQISVT